MFNIGRKQQPANKTEQVVQFRHKDAQRIASVVHAYESSRRVANPSKLPRAAGGGGGGGTFATAFFTGSWAKGTLKQIAFTADTTSTAVASNIFSYIADNSAPSRRCAVALEGTTWILIAAECQ